MIQAGTAGLGTADRIFSAAVFAGVVEASKIFQTALPAEDGLHPFGWIPCEKFGAEFDRIPRCCTDETGRRLCLFACLFSTPAGAAPTFGAGLEGTTGLVETWFSDDV